MLDWLKNKVTAGKQETSKEIAGAELLAQLAPLNQVPGSRIAERLTRFVLTGEDETAVAELAALNSSLQTLHMSSTNFGGYYAKATQPFAEKVSSLIKLLPQDPNLYLRLAKVYEAAQFVPNNPHVQLFSTFIPAFDGDLHWLSTYLVELSHAGQRREPFFPARLVQAMIAANDQDPNHLVRGAFLYGDSQGKKQFSRWVVNRPYSYFQCLSGFPDLVLGSPDIVRQAFRQKDAASRACALQAISALKIPTDSFLEEIASLAVSSSKEVRESAEPLVTGSFAVMQPLIERRAAAGSSEERYHAVRLLARLGGPPSHSFLRGRLDSEKSGKVAEAIRSSLSDAHQGSDSQPTIAVDDYGLSEVPEVPVVVPLDKDVLTDLRACIGEFDRRTAEEYAKNTWAQTHNVKKPKASSNAADNIFAALQDFVVREGDTWNYFDDGYLGTAYQVLQDFPVHPKFELVHLVRWCLIVAGRTKGGSEWRWRLNHTWYEPFSRYQKARKKPIDLRELAAVFRAVGLDEQMIGELFLEQSRYLRTPFLQSDPNAIWPYFAERLDLLEQGLGLTQVVDKRPSIYWREPERRQNALGILKLFPRAPSRFIQFLWDLALGPGKTDRPLAQECLEKVPKRDEKILAALASRQQDARFAAAEWLGRLKNRETIPALRTALTHEKSDVVKDEIVKTLESLGVALEELLDRDKLDQDAAKGLKKGIPKDLEWFPFGQLPTVRWADSGKQVPDVILQWFLVQACRLNSAEAGPMLRRYCSLFQKDDRERLGKFVLEAWIAKDTSPKYNAEQAASLAEREAQVMAGYAKQYPKYYPDFDLQRVYQTIFNRLLTQPEGSQNSTKGILAVAGACCGGDAAPIVHRYVKQWYGYRGAQSKALLQVLAWIDHPGATQVVLSVANRFRTKGIQEEAARLCQLLAARKGWTLDELSDRTIPTAGFDEDAVMELDYGARTFTARLSEQMTITLTNQSGKAISSLPDANQSDDPEKVKQSKAALSSARKELKSVLSMQKERLYEALCTQRQWRFEDWGVHLRKHPIVGRYCQRLVWAACEGDRVTRSFRPLADGTLTDHQDDEITLAPETAIRLAHDQTIDPSDSSAWLQHFSDYKVEPLFQQFGKTSFVLAEQMKAATEISDFLGHIVKTLSLRNRLTRLGYTRGAAEDGGWFYEYHKNFPGLGIEAIIEFTGNGLPEENRMVALKRLYFASKSVDGPLSSRDEISLGELPGVLLTECWNDIRMAAAEGPGFAPDWEKQSEY
jgi:uncharacterized protein DUF4132/HEAT repeat protein